MSHVVEVRALEINGRSGPYRRAGFVWSPGWQQQVLNDEELAEVAKDHFLELRVLDEHTQASRRMVIAIDADNTAKDAESHAKALRAKADSLMSDAHESAAAITSHAPAPLPVHTPYKDSLLAAMPAAVRDTMPGQEAPKAASPPATAPAKKK